MPRLSVHLIAWNGAKYIPYLFESLRKQTYKDWELLAIDNGSKDETADLMEKELQNLPVPARLVRNEKNLGFAGGHNQATREACRPERSEGSRDSQDGRDSSSRQGGTQNDNLPDYIQLLNQDMYLAPDYLERVVSMMDAHPEAGAGQGLLLKWDFSKFLISNFQFPINESLTDLIDTMGLKVMRNRRVVDWRTGEMFQFVISNEVRNLTPSMGQGVRSLGHARDDREGTIEVFGVSGALPIYRRKAIEQVMYNGQTRPTFAIGKSSVGQMFDEDFFMYKEDVDLAFRLRAAGWKAYVATEARAWHDRTAAGPWETSDRAALQNRRTKSAFINYHSYKNHLMVLLKNEHRANFAKDWPWILGYEFKKFVYLLFTDWATLKGLREVKRLWKRTMAKRRIIMENYKVKPEKIREWFVE